MKQILSFLTLGVQDLEKMKEFYKEKFGWSYLKDSGGIVFFKLNGIILGLYPAADLAEDVGVQDDGHGFKRFTLAINFSSEQEVNKAAEELRAKGVKILKEPQKVFWGGYHCYVADIENNYWELAFNPFVTFDKDGNVDTHL
jgi:catechol 2,3-dioxygenase-like lactoylglutathione lyase family enzyme